MSGVRRDRIADGGSGTLAVTLVALVSLVSACSSGSERTGSTASGSSFGDLFNQASTSGSSTQTAATGSSTVSICPPVDIRPGTATMSFNAATNDPSVMGLRYQVAVAQTARECSAAGGTLNIKVGVQGRVVLGPAGGPGVIEAPLRYALVQEGPSPKTLATKLYNIPITIPEGAPNVTFTHIEESLTVPMPGGSEIEAYVVYVGFDPLGAKMKPPAKKQPPQRKRAQ